MKSLFTRLLSVEAIVGAVTLIIVELFSRQLINLLGTANENTYYAKFSIKSFGNYLCMLIKYCCIKKVPKTSTFWHGFSGTHFYHIQYVHLAFGISFLF